MLTRSQPSARGPLAKARRSPVIRSSASKQNIQSNRNCSRGTLQQELPMAMFGRSARLNVRLPLPVGHDQGDLRVFAEQFQRAVRARVVVGDDRGDMPADKVKRIAQDQGLVSDTGNCD